MGISNNNIVSILTESVTSMTSDGSGLEERIRLLKLQLQQKKDEMKRFETEQKRKKKEILRQQEEQLKRKLEVSGYHVSADCTTFVCVCTGRWGKIAQ